MKKKLILLLMPFLLCGSLCLLPIAVEGFATAVKAIKPERITDLDEIHCSGEIIPRKIQEIYLSGGGYADRVYVEIGQKVCKGDLLCSIDTDITASILQSSSQFSQKDLLFGTDPTQYAHYAELLGGGLAKQETDDIKSQPVTEITPALTASMDGTITALNLSEGVFCSGAQPAVVIASSVCDKITIHIRQKDVDRLYLGTKAVITGEGLAGKSYEGILTLIYPAAHDVLSGFATERMIKAQITVLNADEQLKQGYHVDVTLLPTKGEDYLTVPYESVHQDEQDQEYVWTIENGRAKRANIQTGAELSNGIAVIDGLTDDVPVLLADGMIKEGALLRLRRER